MLRVDRLDHAALSQCALENLELTTAKDVSEMDKSHVETAIRVVAAEGIDGLAIGQPREWRRDLDSARSLKNCRQHSLDQRINVVRCDKGRFNIDLGELWLAIGSQIFIAKCFRDLEIFFDPGNHQQLFVLLRRLWQRVKFSRQ